MKPVFLQMFHKLIDNGILRLICIDEVHQFVNFGASFRPEFGDLRRALFSKIVIKPNTDPQFHESSPIPLGDGVLLKIPVLFMTATMNFDLLQQLQLLVGIKLLREMMLWGGRSTFKRRTVKMSMNIASKNLPIIICSTIRNIISSDIQKKLIIYTNTADQARSIAEEIDIVNDEKSLFKGDTLLIIGDQDPEVKHQSAQKFTMDMSNDAIEDSIKSNEFHPRVLVATSSCIGAGLDSDAVYGVIRIGFPTSILNLVQEMGRCGRNRSNNGLSPTDQFILNVTLNDFVYLHERLFINVDEKVKNHKSRVISYEMQRNKQMADLDSVLKFLFLNKSCWHCYLENIIGYPFEPCGDPNDICGGACPVCCDAQNDFIMPARRDGLTSFLVQTFMRNDRNDKYPEYVLKQLEEFDKVGRVIYNRPRSDKPPDSKFLQATIFQLIAAEILQLNIDENDGKGRLSVKLVGDEYKPSYMINSYWDKINKIK